MKTYSYRSGYVFIGEHEGVKWWVYRHWKETHLTTRTIAHFSGIFTGEPGSREATDPEKMPKEIAGAYAIWKMTGGEEGV